MWKSSHHFLSLVLPPPLQKEGFINTWKFLTQAGFERGLAVILSNSKKSLKIFLPVGERYWDPLIFSIPVTTCPQWLHLCGYREAVVCSEISEAVLPLVFIFSKILWNVLVTPNSLPCSNGDPPKPAFDGKPSPRKEESLPLERAGSRIGSATSAKVEDLSLLAPLWSEAE